MRMNENYVLRKVGDTWAIFPIANALSTNSRRIIKINAVGTTILSKLQDEKNVETICEELLNEYDADEDTINRTVAQFVNKMISQGIVVED